MKIRVFLTSPLPIRDLRRYPGHKLFLLPGEHHFIRTSHPCHPQTICYIWQYGIRYGLRLGLSEAYLALLWENGLEVDWNGVEPISEKLILQAAHA
ncbi:MAG: hypothetical protein PHO91_03425 [Patescibacteria group bacterium]|nr:hypothetical protein [Patescibacteria group bacterium]